MYYDRRGTDKTFQTKTRTKLPEQKPRELRKPPVKTYVCMHVLLKIQGPRCVTYFKGVRRCVTKYDRGRGSKLVKNSMTYFMDGPLNAFAHQVNWILAFRFA